MEYLSSGTCCDETVFDAPTSIWMRNERLKARMYKKLSEEGTQESIILLAP
jgi:hypothetical protein